MSFNQACQKLYSDKVSKVVIFGPISNFARSLQASPLKLLNEVAVAVILPDFVKAPDSVSLRITTNTLMITRVCTLYKM